MLGLAVDRERMESLQEDIIDLQGMVVTVFSQAGAVHYPSWKFPDKASCDLDLVPLLDRYGFAEDDPELTTRSHIVLLELIIDRLLLLLQSFTVYAGSLVHEEATSPSSATTGPSMSIGMAARTYWESMVKLGAFYQQLAKEKKGCEDGAPNPSRTEDTRVKSSCFERSESDVTIPGLQASSLASSAGSGLLHGDRTDRSEAKSTPGPSPAPCDTCEKAQLSLREAGHAIIGMCTSQNLPSSLGKFLGTLGETLEHRPLTAMDISYWASEQNKDLSRIRKHLRTLTELIGPLKEELEASREQEEEMRRRIEAFEGRLQKEKEAQEEQRKQAGLLFEQRHQEILQTVAQLEKEKEDLQDKAASLEETVSTLKEKLRSHGATIQELEQAKGDLLQEMRTKMVDKAEVESREKRLEVLAGQLEAVKRQLGLATTELDKEKAKVESVLRHKESLQAKQRALTQQLDRLDQECEQLRAGLADSEEVHVLMKESMKEMQEGRQQTQHRLEEQQRLTEKAEQEKLRMEQCTTELQRTISELGELVQETKKRERLLVLYPDLHVPVEAHFEGTGDVMEDMGKQLRANNIRISVLEEENTRLRSALARMEEATLLREETKGSHGGRHPGSGDAAPSPSRHHWKRGSEWTRRSQQHRRHRHCLPKDSGQPLSKAIFKGGCLQATTVYLCVRGCVLRQGERAAQGPCSLCALHPGSSEIKRTAGRTASGESVKALVLRFWGDTKSLYGRIGHRSRSLQFRPLLLSPEFIDHEPTSKNHALRLLIFGGHFP